MTRWWKRYSFGVLGAGFGLGFLCGIGMLIGSLATTAWRGSEQFGFPEMALHATATDSGDTFSIATGPIADGVEGIFFLDFLTGELQCWVLGSRSGQWMAQFKHNVIADLGIDQGKKPKYLMVTGAANMSRGSAAFRPANSIIYVADANTGRFAAYALPWNRQRAAVSALQFSEMVLIGSGSARNLDFRGQ